MTATTTTAAPKKLPKAAADAERLVMAHRYLYYVECAPVLSDPAYDVIERKARAMPSLANSDIQKVGSSLSSSYTAEQIKKAEELLATGGR